MADTEDDVQVNLVKKMTEIDPKFDAYLKLASQTNQRHQDDEKDISQVIKPKRDRKVTSIGKDAIQLKDSRGKISKDASKGFSNHFQTASIVISEDDLYGGKTGKVVDHSAKNGMQFDFY